MIQEKNRASVGASIIAGVFAVLATCISGVFLIINSALPKMIPNFPVATATPQQSVTTEITSLQNEVQGLQQELDTLNQSLATNPNADVVQLQAKIESLDKRLSMLEQVILDNPAKVLELTLLSRDVENLKSAYQADLENTRNEIDRVYTFSQWFLAAIITLSLGLSSLVISDFLKKRSPSSESNTPDDSKGKK